MQHSTGEVPTLRVGTPPASPPGENSAVTLETASTLPSRRGALSKKRNWSAAGQPAVIHARSGEVTRFEMRPGPSNIRVSGMSRHAPAIVQSERKSVVESFRGS